MEEPRYLELIDCGSGFCLRRRAKIRSQAEVPSCPRRSRKLNANSSSFASFMLIRHLHPFFCKEAWPSVLTAARKYHHRRLPVPTADIRQCKRNQQ